MRNLLVVFSIVLFASCTRVNPGHVGVLVDLLGDEKGSMEVVPVGKYYVGVNEDLYTFPTFEQNYVWTADEQETSPQDESISFQASDGSTINGDFGIRFTIDPEKVLVLFSTYRKGIEEITDGPLRNLVRTAINDFASRTPVEELYSTKKIEMIQYVTKYVQDQVKDKGILVQEIYLVGALRLPQRVIEALDAKVTATQDAQKVENELRKTLAEGEKAIAKARADSAALMIRALSEANANKEIQKTLSKDLIELKKVEKWDGKLAPNSDAIIIRNDN